MSYLVLARKWRPKGFGDLVGQEPITNILKNAISQDKISHAYLFSGPRGIGKTSTARILAKALNCKEGPTPSPCGVCASCTAIADGSSVDVIEIDGASNNSVDDIRDLRERVKYAPSSGKYKVYIIDEVHMLSTSAFNALLKTLEEPPSHVIFVLATTEMKKIPATVLSRCQHMPFRRISSSVIRARLKEISGAEGINISSAALGLVARAADGSMRDSLTILDQLSSFTSEITEEGIKGLLGIADFGMLSGISKAVINGDRVGILDAINLLAEQGTDMRAFAKELAQFFRDLLVASVMRKPEDALDLSDEEMSAVKEIVSSSSEDQLSLMLSEIMKAESDVRNSSSPRLALEMSLIRTSFLSSMKPIKEAIEHIDRYSRKIRGESSGAPSEKAKLHDRAPEPYGDTDKTEIPKTVTKPSVADAEKKTEVPAERQENAAPAREEMGDMADHWKRTLERVDAPLASKLSQADFELKGNELLLTLNGGHAVFEESINKNLKSVEKILSEECGSKVKIKLSILHKKGPRKKDLKDKIMSEPVIREALELFDGRIVEITPLENSENKRNGGENV